MEPRRAIFQMLPGEQGIFPGSVNHPGEAEQHTELMSECNLCNCETAPDELDELNRGKTGQSEGVRYGVLNWVTRERYYYSREVEGHLSYVNPTQHEGHAYDSSEKMDFLTTHHATAGNDNFELPVIFDYTQVVCQDENNGNLDYQVHPIHLQTSNYSANPIDERQCFMNADSANFDYVDQTQNNLRWIVNQNCNVFTERVENPLMYTENYVPITELSLDQEYQLNRPRYGTDTFTDIYVPITGLRQDQEYQANRPGYEIDTSTDDHVPTTELSLDQEYQSNRPGYGTDTFTDNYVPNTGLHLDQEYQVNRPGYGTDTFTDNYVPNTGLHLDQEYQVNRPAYGTDTLTANYVPNTGLHLDQEYQVNRPWYGIDTYTDNYGPTTGLHLDQEYQENILRYGNANSRDSNTGSLDWSFEAQGCNLSDTPLNLPRDRLSTDQYDSGHGLMSESQSSLGNQSGPSGMVNLENSKEGSLPETEKGTRIIKRRRRRSKLSAPPEDVPDEQPDSTLNPMQQIMKSKVLASYRPILPKRPPSPDPSVKKAEEDKLNEIRKRRRGWKCCSQTFDDYNYYKAHVESAHGHQDGPPAAKRPVDLPTQKKTVIEPPKSDSQSILCPFCLTNHDMLGPDITTKPRWNGLNYMLCPLCQKWYKSLRQLKIHFCAHFRVRVNASAPIPCRYCDRRFVLITNLRKHEAVCMIAYAAKHKAEEERQNARSELISEAIAALASIPAAPTAEATISAASAAVSAAAATESAALETASAAVATISTAATAVSTAAVPPPAAAAKSVSREERLFYCSDCGKLFAWESSVKRHKQAHHIAPKEKIEKPKSSTRRQTSPAKPSLASATSEATSKIITFVE